MTRPGPHTERRGNALTHPLVAGSIVLYGPALIALLAAGPQRAVTVLVQTILLATVVMLVAAAVVGRRS